MSLSTMLRGLTLLTEVEAITIMYVLCPLNVNVKPEEITNTYGGEKRVRFVQIIFKFTALFQQFYEEKCLISFLILSNNRV